MKENNQFSLKEILFYIKDEYGKKSFKDESFLDIFSKNAPYLKNELKTFKLLAKLNIISDLLDNSASDIGKQKIVISNVLVKMTESCKLNEQEAKEYLTSLSQVFGYKKEAIPESKILFDELLTVLKNDLGLEMAYCPIGKIGTSDYELGRKDSEEDTEEYKHKVTLTMPFMIGKYPVTQKLYKKIMGNNPSKFKGELHPVENVSWEEAKQFCDKLNTALIKDLPKNFKFDLPTEAQWEYACRASIDSALYNGKNLTSEKDNCENLDEIAWYKGNSSKKTHPVGKKKPNNWGIYDMLGNVNEWCRDVYRAYAHYNNKNELIYPEELFDPVELNHKSNSKFGFELFDNYEFMDSPYVCRGGSSKAEPAFCRCASRIEVDDSLESGNIYGFRIALVFHKKKNTNINKKQINEDNFAKFVKKLKNEFDIDLIYCKPGSFMMGSNGGLKPIINNHDFYIGKFLVTETLFNEVCPKLKVQVSNKPYPVNVNWYEAKQFCDELNFKYAQYIPSGYKFSLPTSEQWQYACCAGEAPEKNKKFNLSDYAWFGLDEKEGIQPIGLKKPNAWGIYDMLGNVFEWVKPDSDIIYDRYVECYGGYWRDENCSVNSAISEEPNNRLGGNIGFRIALVPIE